MSYEFKESDWKQFRKCLPDWQERYMDKLNREYIRILNGEGNPSDRFWKLEERIHKDVKSPGVIVHEMSRSRMWMNLLGLINNKVISIDDLTGFSEELQETVKHFCGLE